VTSVDDAVAAIRVGAPVVLPFDTVYGLAADAHSETAARRLYELKGRAATQPSALVTRDIEHLLACVPELRGPAAAIARALLPGPFTLIFPNPAHRFPWLTGTTPDALGVRVPRLSGPGLEVLARSGAVVATSANRPGERDPATVGDVPAEIRAAAVIVDAGRLPGKPSTVVDLTGPEPRVLREGAVPAAEVLRRLRPAVRSS
jgi:tRNA threonylcarbamoyl adenosine modification protein (Sua5/YciO/YrdC/YwlC family)